MPKRRKAGLTRPFASSRILRAFVCTTLLGDSVSSLIQIKLLLFRTEQFLDLNQVTFADSDHDNEHELESECGKLSRL